MDRTALDTGIQLDNGDLSDTRTDMGTVGPLHRKVLRYETTDAYGGDGDGEGIPQAPRLFYAGSGSIKPLCRACVEGVAGEEARES